MQPNYLKKSKLFFLFLFDSNTTEEQKRFILLNLSKNQYKSIIEILYNLVENKYVKIPPSLQKTIKQNYRLLNKILSTKKPSDRFKHIQKHYKLIYSVLFKGKYILFQVINFK